jgi:hypothetical protein
MRTAVAILMVMSVVGCQSTQTDGSATPGSGVGSTTYTPGTPDTTRSDTTRGARNLPTQPGGATLTLDLTTYSPGGTVAMRIRNQTNDTLGFNQCSSRVVERQEGSRWVAHPEPGRMCTMQLQLLMPNDTTTATTDLPQDIGSGMYRIALTLSRQSATNPGTIRTVSPAFRVN